MMTTTRCAASAFSRSIAPGVGAARSAPMSSWRSIISEALPQERHAATSRGGRVRLASSPGRAQPARMQRGIEREIAFGNFGEDFLVDALGAQKGLEFAAAAGPIDLALEGGEGVVEIEEPELRARFGGTESSGLFRSGTTFGAAAARRGRIDWPGDGFVAVELDQRRLRRSMKAGQKFRSLRAPLASRRSRRFRHARSSERGVRRYSHIADTADVEGAPRFLRAGRGVRRPLRNIARLHATGRRATGPARARRYRQRSRVRDRSVDQRRQARANQLLRQAAGASALHPASRLRPRDQLPAQRWSRN